MMHRRKIKSGRLIVIAAITAAALSLTAVASYIVDYPVTLHPQQYLYYCGPAVLQMNLEKVTGAYPSQDTAYNYAHPYNINQSNSGVEPNGMAAAMAHWTPSGYYYCNWRYVSATGAARGIANNIEQWGQPIAISIMNGGHWFSAHGADTSEYVPGNYNGSSVTGFYITDPLYESGYDFYFYNDRYIAVTSLMDNYFTPVVGGWWNGYYASVERNGNSGNNRASLIDYNTFSDY